MTFVITQDMLRDAVLSSGDRPSVTAGALFYQENEAFSGVNKIATKVIHDMELVFGYLPQVTMDRTKLAKYAIFYGTVDRSPTLQKLEAKNRIDLSTIREQREVFLFQVIEQPFEGIDSALVIAGSDKRGTIYGLFHLSARLGVSPLVNWSHVNPPQKKHSI